ncbi:MAG: hypothetical protein ACOCZJ_02505 [Thermoplasmatota archaeon]
MSVKQEDLTGKDLFLFEEDRLVCCIEGCNWSVDCDSEDPLNDFINHIEIEHIGLTIDGIED